MNEFDQQQPPSLRTVGNEGLQSGAQPLGGGMPINAVAELVVDLLAATGLATPNRLATSAGLAWNNGIAVDGTTLATSHPRIHALGDCITIAGQASRYIEPIGL